ncbi:MAG: iron-sulfur cluster carrier protein ApbC [Hydrogenophilus sp.]|nr:iron-sulfur cluster carrier protein ApbC [Hydrogenophilus sp.]
MSITVEQVRAVLASCVDPNRGRDFVACGAVEQIAVEGTAVSVRLALDYPAKSQWAAIAEEVRAAIRRALSPEAVFVEVYSKIGVHRVAPGLRPLPGVANIVAVASGKGGVGKSTTAVNVALALAAEGATVGVLDADIYGPSIPQMLGVETEQPHSVDGEKMEPIEAYGLQVMSIGFLVEADTPMIWRGPMATQALTQLLNETRWRDVDYLVVDMPPGTGDIHLTLAQRVPITGAVVVTTPQEIALLDARKAIRMFEKVQVPVLGVVENMSWFVCPQCGHGEPLFGEGGGERLCREYGVPFLGALPLERTIREQTDGGRPTVVADPEGKIAERYRAVARQVAIGVAERGKDYSSKMPKVVVK